MRNIKWGSRASRPPRYLIRVLRILTLLAALCAALAAAPASADVAPGSSRPGWQTAPCTPLGCPARRSTTFAHAMGFGAAVLAAGLFARREGSPQREWR